LILDLFNRPLIFLKVFFWSGRRSDASYPAFPVWDKDLVMRKGLSISCLLASDHSGRVLFWIHPGANTTIVPKGVTLPDHARQPTSGPAPQSQDKRDQQPIPTAIMGCEPIASPLVAPDLARFSGRCLA
jgi:hypothetical protein